MELNQPLTNENSRKNMFSDKEVSQKASNANLNINGEQHPVSPVSRAFNT